MRLSIMKVRLQNGEVCFLRDSGKRTVSEDSVATCSATWFCYPYSAASANSPIINKSVHPIWNGLYCKSVSIKKYGDGALITANTKVPSHGVQQATSMKTPLKSLAQCARNLLKATRILKIGLGRLKNLIAEYSTRTANSSAGIPKLRAAK